MKENCQCLNCVADRLTNMVRHALLTGDVEEVAAAAASAGGFASATIRHPSPEYRGCDDTPYAEHWARLYWAFVDAFLWLEGRPLPAEQRALLDTLAEHLALLDEQNEEGGQR